MRPFHLSGHQASIPSQPSRTRQPAVVEPPGLVLSALLRVWLESNVWRKFVMRELVVELLDLIEENEGSHPDLRQGTACLKQFQMMTSDLQHRSGVCQRLELPAF